MPEEDPSDCFECFRDNEDEAACFRADPRDDEELEEDEEDFGTETFRRGGSGWTAGKVAGVKNQDESNHTDEKNEEQTWFDHAS